MSDRVELVNIDKFRRLLRGVGARLDGLPSFTPEVDRITEGRVSGLYLALSHLEECVVRD